MNGSNLTREAQTGNSNPRPRWPAHLRVTTCYYRRVTPDTVVELFPGKFKKPALVGVMTIREMIEVHGYSLRRLAGRFYYGSARIVSGEAER